MPIIKKHFCIAYGGAPILCPPGHTIESLSKAIEVGASMLSVEVRYTRDDEMVIGTSLQRLVNDEPVSLIDKTFSEWRKITDDTNDPITKFDDVLDLVSRTRCGLLVEPRSPGMENALAKKLRMKGLPYDSLLIASASTPTRNMIRGMDPKLPLAHKLPVDHAKTIDAGTLSKIDADAVIWPASVLDSITVKKLKNAGVVVYAGIVNLSSEMRRLRDECSVDGIVSPYPDLLASLNEKPVRKFGIL